mgnify:CR=1 FL=1
MGGHRRPHDTSGEVQERPRAARAAYGSASTASDVDKSSNAEEVELCSCGSYSVVGLAPPPHGRAPYRYGNMPNAATDPHGRGRRRQPVQNVVAFPARLYGRSLRLRSPFMAATSVGGNESPMTPEDSIVVCTSFMIDELTAVQLPY